MALQLNDKELAFVADFKQLLEKHRTTFSCLEVFGDEGELERVVVEFLGEVWMSAEEVCEALGGRQANHSD